MGSYVESTNEVQTIAKLKVYPGADGSFELYSDDGKTYAYESGKFEVTKLKWDDAAGKLSTSGAKYIGETEKNLVEVVGR
jgi:alpha-D-xyloside xylohydrolase